MLIDEYANASEFRKVWLGGMRYVNLNGPERTITTALVIYRLNAAVAVLVERTSVARDSRLL